MLIHIFIITASFESLILSDFYSNINQPAFQQELGVVVGENPNVRFNVRMNGREYDIIVFDNVRLINGMPVLVPWNIEVENSYISARTVKEKFNQQILLSFISSAGASKKARTEQEEVYSITDYSQKRIHSSRINFKNKYLKSITSEHNLCALDRIMNESSIDFELKRAALFFLGDLLTMYKRRNYHSPKIFYEPDSNYLSKSIVQLAGSEWHGENLVLANPKIINEINSLSLKKNFESYLKKTSCSEGLAKNIMLRDFSLVSNCRDDEELIEICKNSEISKIYFVSGTKAEVRAGKSLIKEIKL